MNALREPVDCVYGGADLPVHTSAGIEKNTDTDRDVLILTEVRNVLDLSVLFNNEVILGKVRNISAAAIGDCDDDVHQPYVDSDLCGHNRANR